MDTETKTCGECPAAAMCSRPDAVYCPAADRILFADQGCICTSEFHAAAQERAAAVMARMPNQA